jgi:hypothetical protein
MTGRGLERGLALFCVHLHIRRRPGIHAVSDLDLRCYWRYTPDKTSGEREHHSKLKRHNHIFDYWIKALQ